MSILCETVSTIRLADAARSEEEEMMSEEDRAREEETVKLTDINALGEACDEVRRGHKTRNMRKQYSKILTRDKHSCQASILHIEQKYDQIEKKYERVIPHHSRKPPKRHTSREAS